MSPQSDHRSGGSAIQVPRSPCGTSDCLSRDARIGADHFAGLSAESGSLRALRGRKADRSAARIVGDGERAHTDARCVLTCQQQCGADTSRTLGTSQDIFGHQQTLRCLQAVFHCGQSHLSVAHSGLQVGRQKHELLVARFCLLLRLRSILNRISGSRSYVFGGTFEFYRLGHLRLHAHACCCHSCVALSST